MTGVNLIFCKCCFRTDGQQNSACRHDLLLFYVLRDENFNFSFHISSNKFLNSKLEYLLRGRYIGSIKNRRWDKTIYIDISRAYWFCDIENNAVNRCFCIILSYFPRWKEKLLFGQGFLWRNYWESLPFRNTKSVCFPYPLTCTQIQAQLPEDTARRAQGNSETWNITV